tara:strand:- start:1343 stop:2560 length:1218 start_codon:yes stop_codon:yes gene_type:complete
MPPKKSGKTPAKKPETPENSSDDEDWEPSDKNNIIVILSSGPPPKPPMPPKAPKKRKSSGDPPDEDDQPGSSSPGIDLSEQGPVKGFRDLMRIAQYVKDNAPRPRGRKPKKPKKVTGILRLDRILPHLQDLDKLVGLEDLKDQIAMQIVFFLQDLNSGEEMMHTAIMGPPGMCKTTVSEIIAKIYAELGFLSEGHVVTASRADLIGQYLGETAIKTRQVLEAAEGGVLLLDEAYQLGDPQGRDSFASECINAINQHLSENTEDFMCIVAGYKDKMYKNFFSMNPGLDRRFSWKFTLKPYTTQNLVDIFKYQVEKRKWTYDETVNINRYIDDNKDFFKNNGGDTQVFFDKCKMCHAQRIFTLKDYTRKHLTETDIKEGFKAFKLLKTMGEDDGAEARKEIWSRMYA